VGVNGGVTGSSGQVLALAVGDVLALLLDVPLSQSEVQQEDLVGRLVEAHAEVVRFYVAVQEVPAVDVLDALDHLVDQHEHCLQRELAQGLVEERFERGAHQIHDQHVIVA
jgi:hypothetical protein